VTDSIRSEIALQVLENRVFPDATAVTATGTVGIRANSLDGKYVATNGVSVAPNTGVITVVFDAGSIANQTLVLTPQINTNNGQNLIQWTCSGTVGADKLPSSCQ
jgi:type IV pilus assembly protein PilA